MGGKNQSYRVAGLNWQTGLQAVVLFLWVWITIPQGHANPLTTPLHSILNAIDYLTSESILQNAADHCKEMFYLTEEAEDVRVNYYKRILEVEGDLDSFSKNKYGRKGSGFLGRLRALGKDFEVLIVDPGLVFHLDDFEKFGRNVFPLPPDPWELRRMFKKHLGQETFYRSLALTEEELEIVKREGIKSHGLRLEANERAFIRKFGRNLQGQFENRFDNVRSRIDDVLLSVTKFPSIANMVAMHYQEAGSGDLRRNKRIYQFKLRIPRIDLISPSSNANNLMVSNDPLDRGVESFVSILISPEEVKEIKEIHPGLLTGLKGIFQLNSRQLLKGLKDGLPQ